MQELPQRALRLLELRVKVGGSDDGGQLEDAQRVAGDHHVNGLVGGLVVRRREGCNLVAEQDGQQDGDEVLAVGDEREEPVDGDDLVLEAERRGARGQHLHQPVNGLLRVSGSRQGDVALLHQRIDYEEARIAGNVVEGDEDGRVRNARLAGIELAVVAVGVVVAAERDEVKTDEGQRISLGEVLRHERDYRNGQRAERPSTLPTLSTGFPPRACECVPRWSLLEAHEYRDWRRFQTRVLGFPEFRSFAGHGARR